ncbi:hypothetical protein R1flu_015490 [Riccia fluitans]|uniref:SCA7 domain-containing protein n=1 Tax=Riccia fluitans TaxID=41844 RepID=A0ABD1YM90_9MARC
MSGLKSISSNLEKIIFWTRDWQQSSSRLALMRQSEERGTERAFKRGLESGGAKVGLLHQADEQAGVLSMLHSSTWKSGKGRMAAMERLLAGGSVELSAEEVARENDAVKTVQREMNEADEFNLLEEEDMHVFDRVPLADRLPLVSCNTCKKPIKASHFAAHADRCRSLTASEDTVAELDGGANHKKPPRKARKKLLNAQDNVTVVVDRERLQNMDNDDAAVPDSAGAYVGVLDEQAPGRSGLNNSRGQKRVMNVAEGAGGGAVKVGRSQSNGGVEEGLTGNNANSNARRFSSADLDVLCGVYLETGARCRRYLTCKAHSESSKRAVAGRRRPYDVLLQELKASHNRLRSSKVHDSGIGPLPLATKVYYLRHKQRLRGIIGSLYYEACARESSPGTSPSSFSGEQGIPSAAPPAFLVENFGLEVTQQPDGLQQNLPVVTSTHRDSVSMQGHLSHVSDQSRGHLGGLEAMMPGNQQTESNYFIGGIAPIVTAFVGLLVVRKSSCKYKAAVSLWRCVCHLIEARKRTSGKWFRLGGECCPEQAVEL